MGEYAGYVFSSYLIVGLALLLGFVFPFFKERIFKRDLMYKLDAVRADEIQAGDSK